MVLMFMAQKSYLKGSLLKAHLDVDTRPILKRITENRIFT